MVLSLERSSSLAPLVGFGVRAIDDQALSELLAQLPQAVLQHAQVVVRAEEATDLRRLPPSLAGVPLFVPAEALASAHGVAPDDELAPAEASYAPSPVSPAGLGVAGLPRGAPVPPGRVLYLPRGWMVTPEGQQWRVAPVGARLHLERWSQRSSAAASLAQHHASSHHASSHHDAPHRLQLASGSPRQAAPVDSLTHDRQDGTLDAFFIDIARAAGRLGVGVLTASCGSAGRLGLRALAEAGGVTLLESSSGAERGADGASEGLFSSFVDFQGRIDRLAVELRASLEHLRQMQDKQHGAKLQQEIVAAIPSLARRLHERTSHPFDGYKTNAIAHRVRRRMQVLRIGSFEDYWRRFQSEPEEVEALFRELLIGVTQFFRDPPVFRTLETEVIPRLCSEAAAGDAPHKLRVWVPGCSTGQEAYSLAMLFAEEAERSGSELGVEILATDIDAEALEFARRGVYPRGIEREISAARLRRFFCQRGDHYAVSGPLRELCQFSLHNLISDPPPLRLDMVSCRNLLVYLKPHLQKKLLPLLHQALRPEGVLLFGLSESTRTHTQLFRPVHPRQRIARRRATRKTIEAAQERIAELEQELQSTRAELERARLAIDAANRAKSEFLANMSHEIRTPMTAILGYADLVAEHLADPLALQQIETIRRNGNFLLDIINDILDLSKIEAGKLSIRRRRCDVGQLITDICSSMEVRVQEKGLTLIVDFETPIPETLETDPTRLRQVLVNLLGNAIKFTERGRIEVAVRYLESQQRLEVDVIDTGIGIAAEVQARLFAPFMQVDSAINRQFGGTGLGLAITRRLAEMLGGEVSFESKVGEGSRFTMAIATGSLEGVPRVSPMLKLTRPGSRVRRQTKIDAKILVVDDSRDIRVLASTLLQRAGATVHTADGGEAAVEAVVRADAEGEPFGLVLMDVQMPGMDGPTAVEHLRRAGYTLPIVAVTANAMQGDRERCLRKGYNDYLSKPLDIRSLHATLERYFPADRL